MRLVYNFVIRVFSLTAWVASLWSQKAADWHRGRKNLPEKIAGSLSRDEACLWVHCASLGEFEQGRPVIEELRRLAPGLKIVLTFFSPSGYNVRRNYKGADHVFYLPADTRTNAVKFIDAVNPVAAVFIKYEFWYNYLETLHSRGIPAVLVSGIFRPGQHFFRWYGSFFRKTLSFFSHLFVQDKASAGLLRGIGIGNVTVSGDTRFDRVAGITRLQDGIAALARFAADAKVMVCGSTWPEDEEIIARYRRENPGRLKYIIAPHEVGEHSIERLKKNFGQRILFYSSYNPATLDDYDVFVIDTIGLLSTAYRYGQMAVIGGGFGKGIHNILEAAAWSKPVLFGPEHRKFREATGLISAGGAFTFSCFRQFAEDVEKLLSDDAVMISAALAAGRYIAENQGATKMVVDYLLALPGCRQCQKKS